VLAEILDAWFQTPASTQREDAANVAHLAELESSSGADQL
jgi:hypothetical protein